jgi:hypothetical protein
MEHYSDNFAQQTWLILFGGLGFIPVPLSIPRRLNRFDKGRLALH